MSAEREPSQVERQTIERRGNTMVRNQRVRMESGQNRFYPFIKLKNFDVLSLPRLVTGVSEDAVRERLGHDLRIDYEGNIITNRWSKMKTIQTSSGKRSVKFSRKNPSEVFTNIPRKKYNPEDPDDDRFDPQDPEDLPKDGDAIELVVTRLKKGAESAIRQQDHILKNYGPAELEAEPQRLRRIQLWINETSRTLREEPVTKDQLEQLSQEAAELVHQAGLPSALNETKQKIAAMLTKAAKQDSIGRVNPMISRIRLRSALLGTMQRLVVTEFVNRKFSANKGVLVATREFTRYYLEQAYSELDSIADVVRQLETDPTQISRAKREELASQVRAIASHYLRLPRVKPYLRPTRIVEQFLVGIYGERKDANIPALGEETAEDIYQFHPAVRLLLSNNKEAHKIAGSRIRWSRSILEDALTLPEHNDLDISEEDEAA